MATQNERSRFYTALDAAAMFEEDFSLEFPDEGDWDEGIDRLISADEEDLYPEFSDLASVEKISRPEFGRIRKHDIKKVK